MLSSQDPETLHRGTQGSSSHKKRPKIHSHGRTYNYKKICCTNHLVEIVTLLKQQANKQSELQNLVVNYLANIDPNMASQEDSNDSQTDILSFYEIDQETASQLFLIANEQANNMTATGDFQQAQCLIEHALLLSSLVPKRFQSCLLANISCFHERKN